VTAPAAQGRFAVEERCTSLVDHQAGIARRWVVIDLQKNEYRLVALTARSPGRSGAPQRLLCSCEMEGCPHAEAVRASLSPRPAAA
jgi:hypothetical protein